MNRLFANIEPSRLAGYRTISLVERNNIDCSVIGREAFIRCVSNDLQKANDIYSTAKETYEPDGYGMNLSFVDFDVWPDSNSIPNNCVLAPSSTHEQIGKCFDIISNNKYFKSAHGWAIKYDAKNDSIRSSFRPYFQLLVDHNTASEMHYDAINLAEEIDHFYND